MSATLRRYSHSNAPVGLAVHGRHRANVREEALDTIRHIFAKLKVTGALPFPDASK